MQLPKPCSQYGHYVLEDGSRIYPSGSPSKPIRPGDWFLWVKESEMKTRHPGGKQPVLVRTGSVIMDKAGIRYFISPAEALKWYEKYLKDQWTPKGA